MDASGGHRVRTIIIFVGKSAPEHPDPHRRQSLILVGNKEAKLEIAIAKVVAPNMACQVIDWAIQMYGGAGVCEDFPLAYAYAQARTLRLADGPDEVHRNQIARLELARNARRGRTR